MMKYHDEEIDGIIIVHLSGKIMGGPEMPDLCNTLKKQMKTGSKKILMDFRNVRWINSTGIGSILGCVTTLRKKGGDIRFASLSSAVKHYFHITKIDTVVEVYESIDDAVADFGE
ncbi:MAG: STAS domain-containing protein [bacterium]